MRFKPGLIMLLMFAKVLSGFAEEDTSKAVVEDLFAAPLPDVTEASRPLLPALVIQGYRIEGNTVLPPGEFHFLTNYTGRVEFARIRQALGKLQLRYRDLGFPTISVTLPQQKLTNGIVQVRVIEGKLAKIKVVNNSYFSTANVLRALPSLTTNILIETKWFQPELDRANLNPDRQIYPVIAPGFEPGTTELTLKVKDQLPLHGHMEINNDSTPGTPLLRWDTAVQYDNLWQREHQFGLDYNFSPQAMKPDHNPAQFYDEPMISSYSAFYRLPLGLGGDLREKTDKLPVNFGYDEAAHKFNLPTATGNPDLIVYGSGSTSDTPVTDGPLTPVFSNPLVQINSQSQQRTPTDNYNLGTKLTLPLREFLGVQSSFLFGLDYKYYQAQTDSTNVTTLGVYATNTVNQSTTLVTNEVQYLPSNSSQVLYYLPLALGWTASRPDPWGVFTLTYGQNVFLTPLATARTNFQSVAGSSKAGGNYTTITAGLIREENLPVGWTARVNVNGQWASEPLISNEQFALGGMAGVRGYQEGEAYGDTGWRAQFDLRAPPVKVGDFPSAQEDVPANLRVSLFMDYGQAFLLDRPQAGGNQLSEWGTGISFYVTAGEHFDARLTGGWALAPTRSSANPAQTSVTTTTGECQVNFSVGCRF